MKQYFKTLSLFLKNSAQVQMEYRTNLIFDVLDSLFISGTSMLVLYSMFLKASSIGGWSFNEVATLYGIYMLIDSIIRFVIRPNLTKIPEYIRTGNMDFYLIKPLSSQFLSSFRHFSFWMLPQFLIGLGVVVYGMANSNHFSIVNIPIAFILVLSGLAIIYSLGLMLSTIAFWFVKLDNIHQMLFTFMSAGRVPVSAYPKSVRIMLTFIIPIAFVTTIPAQAALGKINYGFALTSLAISGILLTISHIFWKYAVANYSSASS